MVKNHIFIVQLQDKTGLDSAPHYINSLASGGGGGGGGVQV